MKFILAKVFFQSPIWNQKEIQLNNIKKWNINLLKNAENI